MPINALRWQHVQRFNRPSAMDVDNMLDRKLMIKFIIYKRLSILNIFGHT